STPLKTDRYLTSSNHSQSVHMSITRSNSVNSRNIAASTTTVTRPRRFTRERGVRITTMYSAPSRPAELDEPELDEPETCYERRPAYAVTSRAVPVRADLTETVAQPVQRAGWRWPPTACSAASASSSVATRAIGSPGTALAMASAQLPA